jgi:hypothetical protein
MREYKNELAQRFDDETQFRKWAYTILQKWIDSAARKASVPSVERFSVAASMPATVKVGV